MMICWGRWWIKPRKFVDCRRRTRFFGRRVRETAARLLRCKKKLRGCERRWSGKREDVEGARGRGVDSKKQGETRPSGGVGG